VQGLGEELHHNLLDLGSVVVVVVVVVGGGRRRRRRSHGRRAARKPGGPLSVWGTPTRKLSAMARCIGSRRRD
jgi:hypothetical protein